MVMTEWYRDFIDASHKPTPDELICLFRVEPAAGFSIEDAAGRLASESSVGTWTELTTMKDRIRRLMAKAYDIEGNLVKVAYPLELFEPGNMPQVLSSVAGNIFGMKAVQNLRLENIHWPKRILNSFSGPKLGLSGIRKLFGVKKRPLTATVPKPKLGLTAREHAKAGYEAWMGGVDLLKDDENLTSQPFNKFKERVNECFRLRDKAENETGERKSYLINVTSETNEMLRRAKVVARAGGEYVMVDIITSGWAALQTLRDACEDLKLAIHAHRAFHAAFTRNPLHGSVNACGFRCRTPDWRGPTSHWNCHRETRISKGRGPRAPGQSPAKQCQFREWPVGAGLGHKENCFPCMLRWPPSGPSPRTRQTRWERCCDSSRWRYMGPPRWREGWSHGSSAGDRCGHERIESG